MFLRRVSVLSLLILSLGTAAAFAAPNPKYSNDKLNNQSQGG